jgi:hypothetical protein
MTETAFWKQPASATLAELAATDAGLTSDEAARRLPGFLKPDKSLRGRSQYFEVGRAGICGNLMIAASKKEEPAAQSPICPLPT